MDTERPGPLSAREKLLVEGQYDWIKLWDVHRYVAQENLSARLDEVQDKTIELVRLMIRDELVQVGSLRDHGAHFEPWDAPLDTAVRRLRGEYVDRFHDRAGWPWTLWLSLTDRGKALGRTYQPAYQQGWEHPALPLKFEPGGSAT